MSDLFKRIMQRITLMRRDATALVTGKPSSSSAAASVALHPDAPVMRHAQRTSQRRGCYKLKVQWNSKCEESCPESKHHHHTESCLLFDVYPYSGRQQMDEVRHAFPEATLSAKEMYSAYGFPEVVEMPDGSAATVSILRRRAPAQRSEIPPWMSIDSTLAVIGCAKVSFSEPQEAIFALCRFLKDHPDDQTIYYYRCLNTPEVRGCGRWHMGHSETNRQANLLFRKKIA